MSTLHDVQIILCERCNHTFTARTHPSPTIEQLRPVIPSEADVMHQRTTIAEEENALMRCDAELEKLRKIVENMELEKNALQTRISKRRYLVSAIHRVPVEIWDAIFRYVVVSWPRDCRDSATGYSLHVHYDHHEWDSESEESKDKGSEGEPGDVLAPPLILSQVSSHWRRLVKSLPHLWSSISVDIYGLDRDIRPLLEMYYECSGEHPLTIEIVDSQWQGFGVDCKLQDLRDKFGWDSEQAGRDVFLSLMMEMYRCRELCVDLFKGIIKGDAPDISFPVLRSFTGNGHNSELSFQWLWSAIRQAPQLVHTKTRLLHSLPMIPFRQIKSLTIEYAQGLHRLYRSLTSCVNLETLTILFFQRDLGDENYEDSIVLASVRTCFLRVDDEEPEDMESLLSYLTLPSLVDLTVTWSWSDRGATAPPLGRPWQCLYEFLERSASPLQKLTIEMHPHAFLADEAHVTLSQILQMSQKLTAFTLNLHGVNDQPLTALQSCLSSMLSKLSIPSPFPSSAQVIVPELRSFHLRVVQHREALPTVEIAKDVLSFAKSRSQAQLVLLGISDRVSPIVDLRMTIHNTSRCVELETGGVSARFEKDKDMCGLIGELTMGGMACTIDRFVSFL